MQDPADLGDRDLVDALLHAETGLTAWEIDFAESLDGWLEENDELTERQREVAEEILSRVG